MKKKRNQFFVTKVQKFKVIISRNHKKKYFIQFNPKLSEKKKQYKYHF